MTMSLMIPRQTIQLNPRFLWACRTATWCYIAFSIFSIAIPFLVTPDVITAEQKQLLHVIYEASVFGALLFAFMSWMSSIFNKHVLYQSVTIDNDGLWPAHKCKEDALVRWDDIAEVKERHYWQCLDLIGRDGKTLLKLTYELSGFEALRALAMETVFTRRAVINETITYSRTWLFHAAVGTLVTLFTFLAVVCSRQHPITALIATPFLVWFIFTEYLTSAYKIAIRSDGLDIHFPTLTRSYTYDQIECVYVDDEYLKGYRHPEVGILIKGCDKPFRIRRLGVDAEEIVINVLKAMKPDETGPVMFDKEQHD